MRATDGAAAGGGVSDLHRGVARNAGARPDRRALGLRGAGRQFDGGFAPMKIRGRPAAPSSGRAGAGGGIAGAIKRSVGAVDRHLLAQRQRGRPTGAAFRRPIGGPQTYQGHCRAVRLYRQTRGGEWGDHPHVVERVVADLVAGDVPADFTMRGARPDTPAVVIVAAVADNGDALAMPWHLPGDLKRVKALTMGKPLTGAQDVQSIGRPLPGRANIVLTRDPGFVVDGLRRWPPRGGDGHRAGLGGGRDYSIRRRRDLPPGLPEADRMEWTEVHARPAGDTVFPPFDRSEWAETARPRWPPTGRHWPMTSSPWSKEPCVMKR